MLALTHSLKFGRNNHHNQVNLAYLKHSTYHNVHASSVKHLHLSKNTQSQAHNYMTKVTQLHQNNYTKGKGEA